jgi:predicted metal-binding membrane protein
MSPAAAIQWVSRRDRAVVGGALAGIVVLAWTYILLGAGVDTAMNMAMGDIMMPMPWTLTTFRVMLVMWIVMMTAMMLPSAAPMILLFATINRRRSGTSTPYATGLFALAYLSLWAAFSLAATWAQWGLEHARLLSATMATASTSLAGAVFLLAGVYQLTPLKQACLRRCRSPLEFLSHHWQGGALGAFRMGLRHGLFCLGCCWAMMALLFVGGLMNVLWIAALALCVLAEKVVPAGSLLGQTGGVALILWGGVTLLTVIA